MPFQIFRNPAAQTTVPAAGFDEETRAPGRLHASLPGYVPTALHSCPSIAERLGVGAVLVKDESHRLGLPSFKILGASWATLTTVLDAWAPQYDGVPSLRAATETIDAGEVDSKGRGLVAATDGNHGRGVARMAALLGLSAHILVPAGTARSRIEAIESEGAEVTVVDGTYDDAIAASAALADADHLVISDTSWEGYDQPPRRVVEGYSTLFFEIDDQVEAASAPRPEVVALQAGVGAFAAAGLRHYRSDPSRETRTVLVEPASANCLMVSARAGRISAVPGPHTSTMAGLNCGLPSELVWPIVEAGSDVFVAVDDAHAEAAMRALAAEGIVSGESGAAGLAGLLAVADEGTAEDRRAAGLAHDACVLVVNTEGDTDPENYLAVVGATASEVLARRDHALSAAPR